MTVWKQNLYTVCDGCAKIDILSLFVQGIKSMQDTGPKIKPIRKRTKKSRQRATKISDNEHMQHILQTYDNN